MQNDSDSLFVFALTAAGFAAIWMLHRHSARIRREFAQRNGLASLGRKLPEDFPFESLAPITARAGFKHMLGGARGQDFLLTFEVQVATGRLPSPHTVVARRSPAFRKLVLPSKVPKGLIFREYPEWRIAYAHIGLLGLGATRVLLYPEIEQLWEDMA